MQLRLIKIFSFFALLTLASCIEFDKSKLDNLNGGEVIKIGHGGSGFHRWLPFNPYPSNSMKSLLKALDAGADGLEVDVHMTADGEFVLYHDNTLESTTNKEGCIASYTWREISKTKYKLGAPFDWFHAEKLILLDELVSELKKLNEFPLLQLDLRTHSECFNTDENYLLEKSYIRKLVSYIESSEIPLEKVILISVSRSTLTDVHNINKDMGLSLEVIDDFNEDLNWVVDNQVEYLTVKPRILSRIKSDRAHKKGIKVITFGAKSKTGNKQLLECNPDVVQTDNIEALKELLN